MGKIQCKVKKIYIKLIIIEGYIKYLREIGKVFDSCDHRESLHKFEKEAEVSHGATHISTH